MLCTPAFHTETLKIRKTSKATVLGVSILDESSKAGFANKYDISFPFMGNELRADDPRII